MDDQLSELESVLSVLLGFVRQRAHDAGREGLTDTYLDMVTPPYERELMAAQRTIAILTKAYGNVGIRTYRD